MSGNTEVRKPTNQKHSLWKCITSISSLTSILVSSCLEVAPDRESVHPPFRLTALMSVSQSVEKVGVPASAAQIISVSLRRLCL